MTVKIVGSRYQEFRYFLIHLQVDSKDPLPVAAPVARCAVRARGGAAGMTAEEQLVDSKDTGGTAVLCMAACR